MVIPGCDLGKVNPKNILNLKPGRLRHQEQAGVPESPPTLYSHLNPGGVPLGPGSSGGLI
jgi:hypothetical protein